MLVRKDQMQHIAMLAEVGGQNSIKQLNQTERKAVKVMMEAIQNRSKIAEISLSENEYTILTDKLWTGIGTHKSSSSFFLISFFKGIGNLLGLRVGSKNLSEKVTAAYKPHEAAEKLKKAISPLVSCKELTLDFFDTKMPQINMARLLGHECQAKAIEAQFEKNLTHELSKLKEVLGLRDAFWLGWKLLTSQDTRDAVGNTAQTVSELVALAHAMSENNMDEMMRIVGSTSRFTLMDDMKNHFIRLLDDLINILKSMNESLAHV